MSIQFDGSTILSHNPGGALLDYNAAFTCTFWFRPEDTSTYRGVWDIEGPTGDDIDGVALTGSASFEVDGKINGSYPGGGTGGTQAANVWYFGAVRRTDISHIKLWIDTADVAIGAASSMSGREATDRIMLGRGFGSNFLGRISQLRFWTAVLSDADLAAEKGATTPQTNAGTLWANWRLSSASDLTDTVASRIIDVDSGTPTTGADEPSQGGTNATVTDVLATATAVSKIPAVIGGTNGQLYGQMLANAFGGLTSGETRMIDWLSDSISMVLVDSTYTPDQDNHKYLSDIASGKRVATMANAGGKSVAYDATSNEVRFDIADFSVTGSYTGRYIVVYHDTPVAEADKTLICFFDLLQNYSSTSAEFRVTWDSLGLFYTKAG